MKKRLFHSISVLLILSILRGIIPLSFSAVILDDRLHYEAASKKAFWDNMLKLLLKEGSEKEEENKKEKDGESEPTSLSFKKIIFPLIACAQYQANLRFKTYHNYFFHSLQRFHAERAHSLYLFCHNLKVDC
jgi:hypothetical protein